MRLGDEPHEELAGRMTMRPHAHHPVRHLQHDVHPDGEEHAVDDRVRHPPDDPRSSEEGEDRHDDTADDAGHEYETVAPIVIPLTELAHTSLNEGRETGSDAAHCEKRPLLASHDDRDDATHEVAPDGSHRWHACHRCDREIERQGNEGDRDRRRHILPPVAETLETVPFTPMLCCIHTALF